MIIPYVYDAGALIALDRRDRGAWTRHRIAVDEHRTVLVPAVVVTQVWRDPRTQHNLAMLLRSCEIVPVGDRLARAAGELCARAGSSDAVDALVVAVAGVFGPAIVWTGDAGDIERLRNGLSSPGNLLIRSV